MSFDHVDDYPEIPVSRASTSTVLRTGAWRSVRPVLHERTAPCSAGCPAGIGIPTYLHHIEAGRLDAAFAAITDRNPFPRITGRVCPHPCESSCNLGMRGDEPVSIRAIERWLGDATADLPHHVAHPPTGLSVAVVGSGPAGLSAAFYLRRNGHDVTVFDRRPEPGGLLRFGIPDYRLPTDVVSAEIDRLAAMGIRFSCGVRLGEDVTIAELEARFAAVFIATGAGLERRLGIPGEDLLEQGLAFLESVNRGEATLPGPRCAVIGGGNTAMDVARVLRKLGADVTVLYRRTRAEMPAIAEEYQRAVADGVRFGWLLAPRAVAEHGGGVEVTLERMRIGENDASGRARPEPTGASITLRFDAVFAAVGERADTGPFSPDVQNERGWLDVGGDGTTADPQLFVGGDLATGPATVIEAIVAGRRAARAIDVRLGLGDRWPADAASEVVTPGDVNAAYVPRHPRAPEPSRVAADVFAEDTMTIAGAATRTEIERCYSCGHCNACGTCFVFCPDGAITWDDGPVVDLDYCKGCGICVTECPGHAFILTNERELIDA